MKIPFFKISGLILLILSIYCVFFTKNLFLKFIGSSLFFIIIYLFIYFLIVIIRLSKKQIEFISLSDGTIHPFKNSKIEIEGKNFPFEFPGIFFSLKIDIYENNEFLKKIISNIEFKDKNKFKITVFFDRHQEFTFKNFYFVIQDIFGLTKFQIKCNFEHKITIFPYFISDIDIPFFLEQGGEQIIQNTVKVNSTDFFENRKYYPGDDPRRINWKIFAHSNELHVREVEKIPPKTGKLSLIFAPHSENLYEYEYISSLFLSTIFFLLNNNYEISIYVPFAENSIIISEENEKEFYEILNNSYKLFRNNSLSNLKNFVIFASLDEYKYLSEVYDLSKCSCKIVSFQNNEDKKSLKNSISRIENYDGLIKEIIDKIHKIKNQESRNNQIKKIKQHAMENQIDIEIFRTKNEIFENY